LIRLPRVYPFPLLLPASIPPLDSRANLPSALSNHSIPLSDVQSAFSLSREFFALEDETKAKTPLNGKNAGWEKNTQVRPSTGTADQKESMQLQFSRMEGLWPSDEDVPGFRSRAEKFMGQIQA
jgi:isopenicillin N synthase-like dioxygenase